jgi:RNA polymerase sigma factor (sigma-70 family)
MHKKDPEINFEAFFTELKAERPKPWKDLDIILRKIIISWLRKKIPAILIYKNIRLSGQETEELIMNTYNESYQTLFVKICRQNQGIDSWNGMKRYMFKISENKARELIRGIKSKNKLISTENIDLLLESSSEEFLHDFEYYDFVEILQKEIDDLPEKYRDVLFQYCRGKKVVEIADDLEINADTCRQRKKRAIEMLKSSFGWLH